MRLSILDILFLFLALSFRSPLPPLYLYIHPTSDILSIILPAFIYLFHFSCMTLCILSQTLLVLILCAYTPRSTSSCLYRDVRLLLSGGARYLFRWTYVLDWTHWHTLLYISVPIAHPISNEQTILYIPFILVRLSA